MEELSQAAVNLRPSTEIETGTASISSTSESDTVSYAAVNPATPQKFPHLDGNDLPKPATQAEEITDLGMSHLELKEALERELQRES